MENVADDPFLPDRLGVRLDRDICQRVPGDGFELERELDGSVRHQKMLGARCFRLVVFSMSDLHLNSIRFSSLGFDAWLAVIGLRAAIDGDGFSRATGGASKEGAGDIDKAAVEMSRVVGDRSIGDD